MPRTILTAIWPLTPWCCDDAIHGHWRWHFPGALYQGILPLLASYPQALIWGTSAITLVSGGTVLWVLVVASTFWLAAKTYGLEAAGWAILPLVFSSLGTIWLSGRITGGHLLTLFWHTAAFAILYTCLTRRARWHSAALGLWCGLGVYVDAMFFLTIAGLAVAALFAWFSNGRSRAAIGWVAVFIAAMLVGLIPRGIGQVVEPYNTYPKLFGVTIDPRTLWDHIRLLVSDCLPRLIGGSGFPGIEVPRPVLVMPAFLITLIRTARDVRSSADVARGAIGLGICVCGAFDGRCFHCGRYPFCSRELSLLDLYVDSVGSGVRVNLFPSWRSAVG